MAAKNKTASVASSSTSTSSSGSSAVPSTLQPLTSTESLQHAPSAPNGFVPLNKAQMAHLRKMNKSQRTDVGPVASELEESTTYQQDFGPYAPAQADVVSLLLCTAALIAESANTRAWAKYLTDLTAVTVDAAMAAVGTMGQGLDYALQHNPSLANTYPVLLAFVQTRSVELNKTLATKKAAQKKAAKEAASSSVSGSAAAPAVAAK
jgi:hypothetical protein